MTITSNLDATTNSTGAVLHEVPRPISSASANQVRYAKLGVRIKGDPCPHITPADLLLFDANVFGFCADICPYLVALQTTDCEISDILTVEFHTHFTQINQKLVYCVSCDSGHARNGSDAITFNERRDHFCSVGNFQLIHIEHNA